MGQSQHTRSRHASGRSAPRGAGIALAGLALVVLGGLGGFLLGRVGDATAPELAAGESVPAATSSPAAAPGRPTLLGKVTRVVAGDEVMASVGGAEEPVRVLGLDTPDLGTSAGSAPAACGSREALAYADSRLNGQMVTLVPDPTLPERDVRGARMAYIVLRSQLNFTDAALLDGVGRADVSRPLWYADVFGREQGTAVDAGRGIWGDPCKARP